MRKLILRNQQAPGDSVLLTAAVRDLKRALGAAAAVERGIAQGPPDA